VIIMTNMLSLEETIQFITKVLDEPTTSFALIQEDALIQERIPAQVTGYAVNYGPIAILIAEYFRKKPEETVYGVILAGSSVYEPSASYIFYEKESVVSKHFREMIRGMDDDAPVLCSDRRIAGIVKTIEERVGDSKPMAGEDIGQFLSRGENMDAMMDVERAVTFIQDYLASKRD